MKEIQHYSYRYTAENAEFCLEFFKRNPTTALAKILHHAVLDDMLRRRIPLSIHISVIVAMVGGVGVWMEPISDGDCNLCRSQHH